MYKNTFLENGLRIITEEDEHKNIVTLSYLIKAGCYDEDKDNLGIAHFVEHLLFKGTTTRSAKEISETIECIGGILNAETSFQYTNYWCTVPCKSWKIGIDVLSDMIWNNLIPIDEFEKEKQVIIEELKMYSDNGRNRSWELLMEHMHESYINRQTLGGTIDSVSNITYEQVIDFIDKYYTAQNIVVIATGNINHNDLVNYVNEYTADVEFELSTVEEKDNKKFIPDKLGYEDIIEQKDIAQSHLSWGIFGPKADNHQSVVGTIISTLLAGNSSSRLYQLVRENMGLCYSINASNIILNDISFINGYVGLDKSNIKTVKEIIHNQLNELIVNPVGIIELNNTKEFIKGKNIILNESTLNRCDYIASRIINKNEQSIEDYFKVIDSITPLDIQNYAKKFFRRDNICFTQIIPRY